MMHEENYITSLDSPQQLTWLVQCVITGRGKVESLWDSQDCAGLRKNQIDPNCLNCFDANPPIRFLVYYRIFVLLAKSSHDGTVISDFADNSASPMSLPRAPSMIQMKFYVQQQGEK